MCRIRNSERHVQSGVDVDAVPARVVRIESGIGNVVPAYADEPSIVVADVPRHAEARLRREVEFGSVDRDIPSGPQQSDACISVDRPGVVPKEVPFKQLGDAPNLCLPSGGAGRAGRSKKLFPTVVGPDK